MGGDRGFHIMTEHNAEPLTVAKILKDIVVKEGIELVILEMQLMMIRIKQDKC